MFREIGRGLAWHHHVAALYARARTDPLIAGVDQLREICVGQDLFRQITAGAGDA
jgi:hypothetical protein